MPDYPTTAMGDEGRPDPGPAEGGGGPAEGGGGPAEGGGGPVGGGGAPVDPAYWWGLHLGTEVEPEPTRAALSEGTLVSAAEAAAARWPDREALRVDDDAITHGELQDASRRLARWLSDHGAGPRSAVLVAAPNSVGLVVAYLAALRAGASVTLANPTLTPRELGALIDRVQPSAVVASPDLAPRLPDTDSGDSSPASRRLGPGLGSGDSASRLPDPAPGSGGPPARLILDPGGAAGMPAEVTALAPAEDAAVGSGDIAHLAFTSGTTGVPKAAPLTHGNVLASVRGLIGAWRWSADDVLVHALPLQHPHGLTAVHMALLAGSRSAVLSKFEPAALCRAVAAHRATVLFAVPAVYARLLDWPGLADADLSSLRLAVSGSAPLPARHSDALAEVLGHRPLERYGLTETGFVLSNLCDGERLGGAVGYPLPGAEVRIVDPAGTPTPDGTVGEIVVRGPQVFAGYSGADHGPDDSGARAAAPTSGFLGDAGHGTDDTDARAANLADGFLDGGWFRTGDLGVRDPGTGAVSVTGRSKDVIITGGLNVHPVEVEQVLEAQPGVRAAAVAGLPSERWGEEVTAFVVADGPLDTGELAAVAATALAPYKRPKRYIVVDDLPRNHMGKLVRSRLVACDRPDPGSTA